MKNSEISSKFVKCVDPVSRLYGEQLLYLVFGIYLGTTQV